ncbi:hypothetical protein [Rubritalea sp.]|uniref:hypothetical protein n=1 Tax=Rubritalea sp. TaxID=2109375 RepID=UPI003EF23CF7
MPSKERHEWREDTEEGTRIYKAVFFAKEWRFASALKGSRTNRPDWEDIDEVSEALWEQLRDVLFRKYQRKRCSYRLLESVDKKLGRDTPK